VVHADAKHRMNETALENEENARTRAGTFRVKKEGRVEGQTNRAMITWGASLQLR